MKNSKVVEKSEFIQHTNKYLKWVEDNNSSLVIVENNCSCFTLSKMKYKTLKDLRGSVKVKIHGNINESVMKFVTDGSIKPKRVPGALKGKIKIAKDFNEPLPDETLNSFEGK